MNKRGPYEHPIGIELSGVHLTQNDGPFRFKDHRAEDLKQITEDLKKAGIQTYGIDFDCHCLEISTTKMYSWWETVRSCKAIRKVLMKYEYNPKHPRMVCGGSHVHVGIKNNELKLAIFKDLIMRPYLPWVFGQHDERGAMDVTINRKKEILRVAEYLSFIRANTFERRWDFYQPNDMWINSYDIALFKLQYSDNPDEIVADGYQTTLLRCLGTKRDMVNISNDYGTIEFRFFEMSPTWEEQKLQLEFLFAYINWMTRQYNMGQNTDVHYMSDKELQAIPAKTAIDCFMELCENINVNGDNYKGMIKRNLLPRWGEGYKRL